MNEDMKEITGLMALNEALSLGRKAQKALETAELETVQDLLNCFPYRYEDRRHFERFPTEIDQKACCIRGRVIDCKKQFFGGRRSFYEIVVEEGGENVFQSARMTCRWFNMPYLQKVIASGSEIILYGKPKVYGGRLLMDHPEFELVEGTGDHSIHLNRITPIYKSISGIGQRALREMIWHLLEMIQKESLHPRYDFGDQGWLYEQMKVVHFPEDLKQVHSARRQFAREEFFLIQLKVAWKKRMHQQKKGRIQGKKMALLKEFYQSLPFDLTSGQKQCVREVIKDMRSAHPMNRLLQGDVGAGKTMVALCAMVLAVDSGNQAALMAPTQILAEQHYHTCCRLLEPLGMTIRLVTGARWEESGEKGQEADITIGTHALLYERVEFSNLSCVIIDEQHKFGVAQRNKLIEQGLIPDVLVMTATPIPRTLTLTLYGDLDVSILNELPAGRGKIITAVKTKPPVREVTKFLKKQLEEGRQIYLVYPLVKEGEGKKLKSAEDAHGQWQKRLSHFEVGLLHGRLSAEEKECVSRQFHEGKLDVLVATTVIEVGIDVPNANVMIIYHADRFGLSQLHQLRGRIGRGAHKSYCILETDGKNKDGMQKLEILAKTIDGFEIAEQDLILRGPGEVMGTAQSGMGDVRFVDFLTDTALLLEARQEAESVLNQDAELQRYPLLRSQLNRG